MEALMRVHHILAVAAVVVIVAGAKLMLSSPITAEADIGNIPTMNVLQMQTDHRNMPVRKMRDMTFVFVDGD